MLHSKQRKSGAAYEDLRAGLNESLEAAATIMLKIMGNSQRELSAGEKKPLQTR